MRIGSYIQMLTVVLSFAVSATVQADRSSLTFDGELAAAHDNNVNRAASDDEIRKDSIFGGAFNVRYSQRLSKNSGLLYSLKTKANIFSEFDGLNETTVAGDIKYSIRPGRSFTSSAYSISAFAMERFSSSIIRDSTTFGVTLQLMKPLTDVMTMVTGLGYTDEEAEGDVFDLERARFFINLDTLITRKWTVFATYVLVDGDVVSTASPSPGIGGIADAIEPDDAFGGIASNQFAYRIDALSHLLTLGLNRQINHSSSIDFSIRYLNSTADKDSSFSYDDLLIRAAYLFAF